jgi:hypothetical protein
LFREADGLSRLRTALLGAAEFRRGSRCRASNRLFTIAMTIKAIRDSALKRATFDV